MEKVMHIDLLNGYIRDIDKQLTDKFIPKAIFTTCWAFYFDEDRVMTTVDPPPTYPLLHNILFPNDNSEDSITINLTALVDHLSKEGRLELSDVFTIINKTSELLSKEPNILRLSPQISICGDIKGHFWNLQKTIECGGDPSKRQYLFLGNYVNKGNFGMEVLLYLCAHKLMFPKTFHLLRGNLDSRTLTSFFNFKNEVLYKYKSEALYECIMALFDNLPIAALINNNILCVSGGLSPDISTLKDIEDLNRFQEIPREGPFCDLMWSDPVNEDEYIQHDDMSDNTTDNEPTTWFAYNEVRQCSYVFGTDAIEIFLKNNKLITIIRGHQTPVPNGYSTPACYVNKNTNVSRIITISSAANNNKWACAMILLDSDEIKIQQFVPASHAYYLPDFMDAFQWSLPFVAEKVTDMIYEVLKYCNQKNIDNNVHNME